MATSLLLASLLWLTPVDHQFRSSDAPQALIYSELMPPIWIQHSEGSMPSIYSVPDPWEWPADISMSGQDRREPEVPPN